VGSFLLPLSGAHVPKIEKRFVLRLQRVLIGVSFGVDRCPCEQDDYGREVGTQPEQGLAGLRRLWQTHHGEVSVSSSLVFNSMRTLGMQMICVACARIDCLKSTFCYLMITFAIIFPLTFISFLTDF
jgi:hypothetical protein